MAVGRPTKYTPEMCETVIRVMSEGGSKAEAAAELGITRETFNEWSKSNKDFSDAVNEGVSLAEAWWNKIGRTAVMGGVNNFNATAWVFNMKNRFGWADKQETTHRGGLTLGLSEVDGEI